VLVSFAPGIQAMAGRHVETDGRALRCFHEKSFVPASALLPAMGNIKRVNRAISM
jgi:hypothetical protein